jgi:hypothetical protein
MFLNICSPICALLWQQQEHVDVDKSSQGHAQFACIGDVYFVILPATEQRGHHKPAALFQRSAASAICRLPRPVWVLSRLGRQWGGGKRGRLSDGKVQQPRCPRAAGEHDCCVHDVELLRAGGHFYFGP